MASSPRVAYGTVTRFARASGWKGFRRTLASVVALAAAFALAATVMRAGLDIRGSSAVELKDVGRNTQPLGLGLVGVAPPDIDIATAPSAGEFREIHGDLRSQAKRLREEATKLRTEQAEVRTKQLQIQARLGQAWRRGGQERALAASTHRPIPDGKVAGYLSNSQKQKVVSEYVRAVSAKQTAEATAFPHHSQSEQSPSLRASSASGLSVTGAPLAADGVPWQGAMGTDISFISTKDFPLSMINGGHARHPALKHTSRVAHTGGEVEEQEVQEGDLSREPVAVRGHKWSAPMGTDIAFINTLDFPKSMVGAEHASRTSQVIHKDASMSTNLSSRSRIHEAQRSVGNERDEGESREGGQTAKGEMQMAWKVSQLSLGDYGLTADDELRMEQHVKAAENQTWTHPEHKGSPCSVSGNCNHGSMQVNDPMAVRQRFLERYFAEGEDGNGHEIVPGGDTDASEGEEKEGLDDEAEQRGDEGEEEKRTKLGNNLLMMSMDDFVTRDDAYAHNELTSGAEGFDHFGHLAPHSEENRKMLYGSAFTGNHSITSQDVFGVDAHPSPTRGAVVENILGDHQVGGADVEVNVTEARPHAPGLERDRLGRVAPEEDYNQRLMNGRYYRVLRRDGVLDRETPVDEARAQMWGASHDRQPIPDLAFGDWNVGFGGSSTGREQAWERAREVAHGDDWRAKVNTGTHEQIEKGLGVTRNMAQEGAYFKGSEGAGGAGLILSDSIRF
mmetsp:Transcript_39842/g.96123  ORF Transcript_39842/g.96123 Transcript_39842/m.96123 type:complete len:732 (+) Transcript_39842:114-2309(+)